MASLFGRDPIHTTLSERMGLLDSVSRIRPIPLKDVKWELMKESFWRADVALRCAGALSVCGNWLIVEQADNKIIKYIEKKTNNTRDRREFMATPAAF
jgi:hypothetical protein